MVAAERVVDAAGNPTTGVTMAQLMEVLQNQQAAQMKQMMELVEALKMKSGGGEGRKESGDGRGKRRIESKEYMRVEKFGGGDDAFRVWREEVQVITGAIDAKVEEMMREVERKGLEVTGAEMERADVDGSLVDFGRKGRELYEILFTLTSGEAKIVIKNAGGGDGFAAWGILTSLYNKKSLGKVLRVYREVMMPRQVELEGVLSEVGKWDVKVRELEATEGETVPGTFKLAALTEMCPDEVRDLIYAHVDGVGGYKGMRDLVAGWVANKIAAKKGMVVGCVRTGVGEQGTEGEEVDVGLLRCYQCGGVGHPQRLCPTERQVKGMTNGAGKGQPKGAGHWQ